MLGGDFHVSIGPVASFEPVEVVGAGSAGERNEPGDSLVQFVLEEGFMILSRQGPARNYWTCCRSLDGALVQLDFILGDSLCTLVAFWHDFAIPIGFAELVSSGGLVHTTGNAHFGRVGDRL